MPQYQQKGQTMVSSEVRLSGGVPTLFIDGRPVPGMAYITYFRADARYRQFADAGYRLFSIPVYFGDQGPTSKPRVATSKAATWPTGSA